MKRNKFFLGFSAFLAVFAASSAVVMLLWNWLIPAVIGWSVIGYWQAAGLLLLCKLLFAGFGRGCFSYHPHFSSRDRAKMWEQMRSMSADERREHIRSHFFGAGPCRPCGKPDGEN